MTLRAPLRGPVSGYRPLSRYDPAQIEPKWQAAWDADQTFLAERDPAKPKYYVLEMFPYPSGRIHVGHVRNYTMGDVIARYKLSNGFSILPEYPSSVLPIPSDQTSPPPIVGHCAPYRP